MSLTKFTSVPNPDLNGGQPYPIYIDTRRIILVTRTTYQPPKIGRVEERQEMVRSLYAAACNLTDHVGGYVPKMDDPVAVEWMMTARTVAQEVQNAYQKASYYAREHDFHPRVECTEIQLACGTAVENDVMLARVWVMEQPEDIADRINFVQR